MPAVRSLSGPGDPAWKAIQHFRGITAFGITAFVARAAGDVLAPAHDEAGFGQEEAYVVLSGRVEMTLGDERHELAAGGVIAVRDPALIRSARALDAGTTLLAVGCAPGSFASSWRPAHFVGEPRHAAL